MAALLLFNSDSLNPILIFFGISALGMAAALAYSGTKLLWAGSSGRVTKATNMVFGALLVVAGMAFAGLGITLLATV